MVYGHDKRIAAMAVGFLLALFSEFATSVKQDLTIDGRDKGGILLCNLIQIGMGFPSVAHLHLLAPAELYIDAITLTLSAFINVWATSMIAYSAW